MKKNKEFVKPHHVDVVFRSPCNFLNKPRVAQDEACVTIAQAENLKAKQLIEEY